MLQSGRKAAERRFQSSTNTAEATETTLDVREAVESERSEHEASDESSTSIRSTSTGTGTSTADCQIQHSSGAVRAVVQLQRRRGVAPAA